MHAGRYLYHAQVQHHHHFGASLMVIIRVVVKHFIKVTVQFERCFRLMEHISVILCRNPRNLYITEKLIKFSKSLFYLYLVISN